MEDEKKTLTGEEIKKAETGDMQEQAPADFMLSENSGGDMDDLYELTGEIGGDPLRELDGQQDMTRTIQVSKATIQIAAKEVRPGGEKTSGARDEASDGSSGLVSRDTIVTGLTGLEDVPDYTLVTGIDDIPDDTIFSHYESHPRDTIVKVMERDTLEADLAESASDPEKATKAIDSGDLRRTQAVTRVREAVKDPEKAKTQVFRGGESTKVIDWKKAEEEDDGTYKGKHNEPVSYGLSEEDGFVDNPQVEEVDAKEIQAKIKRRRKEKEAKRRREQQRFWIILSSVLLLAGAFVFSLSGFFTVDHIEVRGSTHFTSEEIINIAHAVPGRNLIYHPEKQEIKKYLEQNPYIKSAKVTRKLPSTLVITVKERQQACAFKYDDDYLVMDDEGILLRKTRTEPKITMIKGLVVNKIKLGELIGMEDPMLFQKTLKIVRTMNKADLYFISIEMGEDDAVRAYIYEHLSVKTTYDKLIENLENGRLHLVVDKLFEENIKRGTITFRDDGMASFEPGI